MSSWVHEFFAKYHWLVIIALLVIGIAMLILSHNAILHSFAEAVIK